VEGGGDEHVCFLCGGFTLAGSGAFHCIDPLLLRFSYLITKGRLMDAEIISEFLKITPFVPIFRISEPHDCLPLV